MKKIISVRLFFLFICALCIFSNAKGQGFLKAKDRIIVNEKGEKVILRGMGLGGWMLQEGYMFRLSNLGQQYRIKAKIEDVVGAEKTNAFYQRWLSNHTTEKDIDSMAKWGFNSIRLPMHYNLYTPAVEEEPVAGQNTWINKGFAMTDSLLKWCKKNKMYLILDLHATPGGQGNDLPISDRDPAKPSLWQSEANQQKMIAFWVKLAQRYANEPWIGGYDIINEPNWGFEDPKDFRGTAERRNEPLRKLMIDITKAIRTVDKKHIIIIEGNGFGNNYHGVMPTWDDNLVMSFHKYGNFNTTEAIQHFLNWSKENNIPLWLGESGENSNTWFAEAIHLVESNNIGWAWWQQKKMGINNPAEIKVPTGYENLLNYWSGRGAKPTAEEAWQTLEALLENIKIENNVIHHDVIDAMFRQVNDFTAKPFKQHTIGAATIINAVDFDMGRQRAAYYDKDTASYQYTPGVNTAGNRGRTYRNDGVDIQQGVDGPVVFHTEDGEWLQYTVNVSAGGDYDVSFRTAADSVQGNISLYAGDVKIVNEVPVVKTTSMQQYEWTAAARIKLEKGKQSIRLFIHKGYLNLHSIRFVRK